MELTAGVGWQRDRFQVSVLDCHHDRIVERADFTASQVSELISFLSGFGHKPDVVIDSTNGVLDGQLMAANFIVYRVDPDSLPSRTGFRSAAPETIARSGCAANQPLTRLQRRRGTQTGREDELQKDMSECLSDLEDLIADGSCLTAGSREIRQVALTFDDGPSRYTDGVLDVLDEFGVPATFFCVGINAAANAETVHRIVEAGHAVGNHSWSHPFLTELSFEEFQLQLGETERLLSGLTGSPPELFRPPYGCRNRRVLRWLRASTARLILWDVAPDDWAMPGVDTIVERVIESVRPGSIILLHDGGGDRSQTLEALPVIIGSLLGDGHRFVTVNDLQLGT